MEGRVALPRGTLLDGSYRIERVIGSGGFGVTYEAEDVRLSTKVAIKEYYPGDFSRRDDSLSVRPTSERQKPTFEWGRSSFLEEARTLARFRHHSVVRVTRVFEAYSTAYMVMEFERGQSLEAWLRHLGRPPTQEELDCIAAPLLDALEMMHAENFLHRDIAPDNIIVRADGSPVLLDFGAARRAVAEMSRALTGIVKAGYSPQEQYASDSRLQGPWSDIYALGATLYRAVVGKPPEESTLRREDDRTLPAAVAAPGGLYRMTFLSAVDACLNVERAKRPQSVAELRPKLLGIGVAPVKPQEFLSANQGTTKLPMPAKRWPAIAVAALVLVGGAFAGLYYMRWSPEGSRPAVDPGAAEEARAWAAVKDTTSIPTLDAFITRFPQSFFAEIARVRIAELKQLRAAEEARERADEEAKEKSRAEAKRAEEERKAAEVRARQEAEAKRKAENPSRPSWEQALACSDVLLEVGAGEWRCMTPGAGKTESFKDCPECPEMVVVPAGSFLMGTPPALRKSDWEGPQHTVTFKAPFALGKYAITRGEYEKFAIETGQPANWCYIHGTYESANWALQSNRSWRSPGFPQNSQHPVVCVNGREAKAYVAWLSKKTRRHYRLLSEAEHEYATRAQTTTRFYFGDDLNEICKYANYADLTGKSMFPRWNPINCRDGYIHTAPVGSFKPNPWGLYDMHGNASTIVEDCQSPKYVQPPSDGSPRSTGVCDHSGLRGGSWIDGLDNSIGSAARDGTAGEDQDASYNHVGFRVARTLSP